MALTSISASSAYCTPTQCFLFIQPNLFADMLRATQESPRPSYLAMLDSTNPAGIKLLNHLNLAAGEIEAACAIAKRYLPLDLQALTGVSQVLLQGLNAYRALWSAYKRLKPGTAQFKDVPGAVESAELLAALRDGQAIFSFSETAAAGIPEVKPADPNKLLTPNVVFEARRLFPLAGLNRLLGGGD